MASAGMIAPGVGMITLWGAVVAVPPAPACAQTAIDEWATVGLPSPPALKPVTVTPDTALLVMDFTRQTCTPERRLRCANSVPGSQSSSPPRAPRAPW